MLQSLQAENYYGNKTNKYTVMKISDRKKKESWQYDTKIDL